MFCSHHASLVELIGESRVRSGDHPRRRMAAAQEPLVAETETLSRSRGGDVLLRQRVAALDEDQRQLLRKALAA